MEALPYAIKAGQRTEKEINSYYLPDGSKYLPDPESLAYEKTLFPFIILSKKRYVGNLYEDDAKKKPKQKSMGIVLKRRDNAPIVKKIYGGIIDILLNHHDLNASVEFLKGQLQELVDGKVPLEELIITKTLKAEYKDPTKIAHKVLADRMGERDEGNRPAANDRIPYVYIHAPDAQLQGDRIEHPDYIRETKLVPDYRFYITNQIMKPVAQLFALCVEQLPGYAYPPGYWMEMDEDLSGKAMYKNEKKRAVRIGDLRMKCAVEMLFDPYLEQLGATPKRKAPMSATKSKVENRAKRLANHAALSVTHELVMEMSGPKVKDYTGKLSFTKMDTKEALWTKTVTYAARDAKNKTLCQIKLLEATFQELHNSKLLPTQAAVCVKANAYFVRKWKKALIDADDLAENIRKAIETNDFGAMEENMEVQLFLNLVSMAEKVPYVLETL